MVRQEELEKIVRGDRPFQSDRWLLLVVVSQAPVEGI
jgi:hypothetical protein